MKIDILHYCDDTSDIININPLKDQLNFNRTSHNHVAPWGKIFNKKLINDNDIRFPEDTLAEDTYFYFKECPPKLNFNFGSYFLEYGCCEL